MEFSKQTRLGRRRKKRLIVILGGECAVCHIKYTVDNWLIFDFHHKVRGTKKFMLNVRNLSKRTWKECIKEAHKCDVVCSNCHRMIHKEDFN